MMLGANLARQHIMSNVNVTFVNVPSWAPHQVAGWIRGLDDALLPYAIAFQNAGVTGKRLLGLSYGELEKLQVTALGHQELIMEAVELLCALHYEVDTQTLQVLALQLCCKARSLLNEVCASKHSPLLDNQQQNMRRLPLKCLTGVADIVSSTKTVVSWLDRAPFEGTKEYTQMKNSFIQLGTEMVSATQGENIIAAQESIIKNCEKLCEICEQLVTESTDPLVLQPCSVEMATIRKKPEEELGMHIQSAYNGTHVIGRIKEESPADRCGKIEEGDEVVQVNYQTVVGWQLKKLVTALKENEKEVTLTLKKRPRHSNPFGHSPKKRSKVPKSLKQSTFPKTGRRKSREEKGRSNLKDFIQSIPTTSSSEPFQPTAENDTDPELENEVFQSGGTLPVLQIDAKQRRATVSGGSPTAAQRAEADQQQDMSDDGGLDAPPSPALPPPRPKAHTFSSPPPPGSSGSPVPSAFSPVVTSSTQAQRLGNVTSSSSAFMPPTRIAGVTSTSTSSPTSSAPVTHISTRSASSTSPCLPNSAISIYQRVTHNSTSDSNTIPGVKPVAIISVPTSRSSSSSTSQMSSPGGLLSPVGRLSSSSSQVASPVCTPGSGRPIISPTAKMYVHTQRGTTPERSVGGSRAKSPPVESPRRRKASEAATREIAGCGNDTPKLVQITRIDSWGRAEMAERPDVPSEQSECTERMLTKKDSSRGGGAMHDSANDKQDNYTTSYTVNIVGGVPQKVPVKKDSTPEIQLEQSPSPGASIRRKNFVRRIGANRRISCKDLGGGDCQGWLYKRREGGGLIQSKWVKRWFVLKEKDLYYYKDQEDLKAQGVITLPGFQVSPCPEIKSKKYAFKAHHSGTTFHFASERQDDMGKWMNKMGLAAIVFDTRKITTTAGFGEKREPPIPEVYYSEESDEDNSSPEKSLPGTPSTPRHTPRQTPSTSTHSSMEDLLEKGENITDLYSNIRRANLTLDGVDVKTRRNTRLTPSTDLELENPEEVLVTRRLLSLERTVKDKEEELAFIDSLLQSNPTSNNLKCFVSSHPGIVENIRGHVHERSDDEESLF